MTEQNITSLGVVFQTDLFFASKTLANDSDSTDLLPFILLIDMQFNGGHVVTISMYALLCILPAIGITVTCIQAILSFKNIVQYFFIPVNLRQKQLFCSRRLIMEN